MAFIEISVLLVMVVLVVLFALMLKKFLALAVNSLIGFFALFAVQAWVLPNLVINIWSVLITAVGGIVGLIVVIALHVTGGAF